MAERIMTQGYVSHSENTSTAHRYANADWSEDKNLSIYGEDYSRDGLGHNFQIEVLYFDLNVDLESFKSSVYEVSRSIDHKFLDQGATTLEWITKSIWERLKPQWAHHQLQVKVKEGPRLWASYDGNTHTLIFRSKFSAVHKHWREELTPAQNQELYGKCSHLHGHEYLVDLVVQGVWSEETRLLISRRYVHGLFLEEVLPLSGTYLNERLGNTSGEKIARYFYYRLKNKFLPHSLKEVAVHETRKNSFIFRG